MVAITIIEARRNVFREDETLFVFFWLKESDKPLEHNDQIELSLETNVQLNDSLYSAVWMLLLYG